MAKNVIINEVIYSNVPEVDIPQSGGGTAQFFDISDATLSNGNSLLSGVTAYGNGVKYTGTISTKTGSDLTVSGGTVNVPAGYYAAATSKSIANGSASTPATTISITPSINVGSDGLISVAASASQSVTPTVSAGYVSSGTSGVITVSGSNSEQLTTQGATIYTPTTSDQTIASGTYLTGTQTISGDSNLVANNIRSGVSIFGVDGALTAATVTQDGVTKILSIS